MPKLILTVVLIGYSLISSGQSSRDYSVLLSASVDTQTHAIIVHWPQDNTVTNYLLSRKKVTDASWTKFIGLVPGSAVQYRDTSVQVGEVYEYRVQKIANGYNGYGYILAGKTQRPTVSWGRVLLVIDTTHWSFLSSRILRLEQDLQQEGWLTHKILVDRADAVPKVKNEIVAAYQQDPLRTNAVLLIGHVPVPYSGNIVPDGHTNNHHGAWPADVYYGDMDGVWTDAVINVSNMPARTNNVPGDGKFDQSTPPSSIELMVGRIDLANLPAFSASEDVLLARYLDKNHAYRTGQWNTRDRAVIDDNFGGFNGEAFASNGWRNFSVLLGQDSIQAADYRTTMDTGSYYWSYGCGGGSYTSANGIGNTNQLAGDSLQGIFTLLFGSYFGDWDVSNNFLRAPLAQGNILTNAWAGRPNWQFHTMAQGYPIGFAARSAQNNSATYITGFGARQVHTALMGDPTLRMWPMQPVSGLTTGRADKHVAMNWDLHPQATHYFVYEWDAQEGSWLELAKSLDHHWVDSCRLYSRNIRYAVRAAYPHETPSGSFVNLSPMAVDSLVIDNRFLDIDFDFEVRSDTLFYSDSTREARSFTIHFGDGTSDTARSGMHIYVSAGQKILTMSYHNSCEQDSLTLPILITFPAGSDPIETFPATVAPNPFTHSLTIRADQPWSSLEIVDVLGQRMVEIGSDQQLQWHTQNWSPGWYMVMLTNKKGQRFRYPLLKL